MEDQASSAGWQDLLERRWIPTLAILMSGVLLQSMNALLLTTVLPSIAAELGTMKVTEQIDALRALGVHPVDYLVTPRMVAMMVSMPLLVAESIAFAISFSWLVAVPMFNLSHVFYMDHMKAYTDTADLSFSLVKGFVFGIIIVLASCHQGFSVRNGAEGVGRNTTVAVVSASLLILVTNFFLTLALNLVFPAGFIRM